MSVHSPDFVRRTVWNTKMIDTPILAIFMSKDLPILAIFIETFLDFSHLFKMWKRLYIEAFHIFEKWLKNSP